MTYFEWNLSLFIGYILAMVVIAEVWFLAVWHLSPHCRLIICCGWYRLVPALVCVEPGGVDLMSYLKKSDEDIRLRARNFFGTLVAKMMAAMRSRTPFPYPRPHYARRPVY